MNRRLFVAGLALSALLSTGAAFAADKPNLSGNWKLNAGKSDFGMMPAPDKMERTIEQNDPVVKITTNSSGPQGDNTNTITYKADGTESSNDLRGMVVKSVANWEGEKLIVKSKREVQGMEISVTETWSLGDAGKSLIILNNVSTPQGDFEVKIVMDKQ